MSVDRIRREAGLAGHVAMMVETQLPAAERPSTGWGRCARRWGRTRTGSGRWSRNLCRMVAPAATCPGRSWPACRSSFPWRLPFAKTFLWPLAVLALAVFAISWGMRGFALHGILPAVGAGLGDGLGRGAGDRWVFYGLLRRREAGGVPVDRPPERHSVDAIMARENFASQNHLAALSVMKPGMLRRCALRLAFWFVAQLSARYYRPGFLGDPRDDPFRALGDRSRHAQPALPVQLRRQLGKLPGGLHHQGPYRPHRHLVEHR